VGLGSIGSKVATRLKAFGCQISYSSRNRKPYAVPYNYYMDIEEMVANCNALIICCELNENTLRLINKDVLSALGKHGVIVNVALGAIIDEEEMVILVVLVWMFLKMSLMFLRSFLNWIMLFSLHIVLL